MNAHCPTCDAELPPASQYCIECGRPVTLAATGQTQQLQPRADGTRCPSCATLNPPQARFCVMCGQTLSGAPQPTLATPPAPPLLPALEPAAPLTASQPFTPAQTRPAPGTGRMALGGLTAGVFLIGLAILALLD